MELSRPKLKKLLIFQERNFQAQKIKKNPPQKTFLYFEKWNFPVTSLKKSLKNFFLIFQEGTCKAQKTKISYASGNETF